MKSLSNPSAQCGNAPEPSAQNFVDSSINLTSPPIPKHKSRTPSDRQECQACSLTYQEWMTTEEAARYLGMSCGALRNMTSNGNVPYYKLGRRNRYLVDDLRNLLLTERRGP